MTFFCYSLLDQSVFVPSQSDSTIILPRVHLDYHLKNRLFEESLIDWCKHFCSADGCFVDIGSHTGTYAIKLAKYSKNVMAFEPQRQTFYALCGSVALSNLSNITCYNTALGSEPQVGEATLSIPSVDGGGSSILGCVNPISEEKVEVKTLDSYNIENISFIKIDVEGNEPEVLEGARQTLTKYRPSVLFEDNSHSFDPLKYKVLSDLQYNVKKVENYNNMFLATRFVF